VATLLVRAGYLWCGDEAGTDLAGGAVLAVDGRIERVGTPDEGWPRPDEVLDASSCLVVPGLVNTHHHLYQTLTRAYSPALGCDLFDWLRTLYPVWSRLDEESAYVSAWVGLAELLLSGCTTSTDHLYLHPRGRTGLVDAEIRAARDLGIRFHPTRGSMSLSEKDGGLPPDDVVEEEDDILADCERAVSTHHDPAPGAMVRVALAPCSPFSVSPSLMERSAELAERLDVRLHTHMAETENEIRYCQERFGVRPHELGRRLGWVGPRTWYAHSVWTDPDEISMLAAAGTSVAHCPTSNMILGAGVCPVNDLRAAGVAVGLGCDGSASHDVSDLWGEVRQALLLAHLRDGAVSATSRDVLRLATAGGAACLGREDIGAVEPGRRADLACFPLDGIATAGAVLDPVEAAVRCGVRSARHTVVEGVVLVRDGRLVADPEAMVARHRAIAARWAEAAGAGLAPGVLTGIPGPA
jgi:cytosine/adenosine deaminase-related metal-dependent hydrolase